MKQIKSRLETCVAETVSISRKRMLLKKKQAEAAKAAASAATATTGGMARPESGDTRIGASGWGASAPTPSAVNTSSPKSGADRLSSSFNTPYSRRRPIGSGSAGSTGFGGSGGLQPRGSLGSSAPRGFGSKGTIGPSGGSGGGPADGQISSPVNSSLDSGRLGSSQRSSGFGSRGSFGAGSTSGRYVPPGDGSAPSYRGTGMTSPRGSSSSAYAQSIKSPTDKRLGVGTPRRSKPGGVSVSGVNSRVGPSKFGREGGTSHPSSPNVATAQRTPRSTGFSSVGDKGGRASIGSGHRDRDDGGHQGGYYRHGGFGGAKRERERERDARDRRDDRRDRRDGQDGYYRGHTR